LFVKKADNNDKIIKHDRVAKKHHHGCKYSIYCKYFDANSTACTIDDIASSYCGAYDLFDNFIIDKAAPVAKE